MAQPWFKKWAGDYLSDSNILILSWEQRGFLEALWCHACKDGSIPADFAMVARLLPNISPKAAKELKTWIPTFFTPSEDTPGRLVSLRMLREQAEYETTVERRRESASRAGKASAAKRAINGADHTEPTSVQPPSNERSTKHRSTSVQRNPTESESESVKELLPPTPSGGGAPPASAGGGEGRGVQPRVKRRSRAQILEPFPPALREWVNRLVKRWPTEDAKDGRAVRPDPEVLAENVQRILAAQPELDLQLLEDAALAYLDSHPQRWKAPQFFFGPGKGEDGPAWRPWARAALGNRAPQPLATGAA